MNDQAIDIVQKYLTESLFEPKIYWPRREFDRRSNEIWAAKEIIKLLQNNPDESYFVIIENFISKMDSYYEMTSFGRPFAMAREAGKDILRLFM